jgi:hypothetical protein
MDSCAGRDVTSLPPQIYHFSCIFSEIRRIAHRFDGQDDRHIIFWVIILVIFLVTTLDGLLHFIIASAISPLFLLANKSSIILKSFHHIWR